MSQELLILINKRLVGALQALGPPWGLGNEENDPRLAEGDL